MKELSRRASAVQPSSTMAIDALAKQMIADGMDVVSFAAGEPDFHTPEHIKNAGIKAIQENFTRYTPASGTVSLKKAVCQRIKEDYDVEYKPSQVAVSGGAKHCVFLTLQALVNPGDEILIPAPFWVSYLEMVKMAGGTPVVLHTDESTHFKLSPERLREAITSKTKAILLNNPNNPSGMLYSREELEALVNICLEYDLYIISDEIYSCLVYDGAEFTSVAALGEDAKAHTIIISGVSKIYAMTGWRIGYILAEESIIKVISSYLSQSTGSPCSISQAASEFALTSSQELVYTMREAFEERRNYIVDRINRMEGVSCLKPDGAFYVLMNIEKLLGTTICGERIDSCDDFSTALLKHGLVATVPGSGFSIPTCIRWSYSNSMENIKKGMDRLEAFLQNR